MRHPRIHPRGWQPPPPKSHQPEPTPGPTVIDINGTGPEDVVVDSQGRILTGVDDGRILRLHPDGSRIDILAHTAGRPLGIELLPDEDLLVCDAERGLLRVELTEGRTTTLMPRGTDGLRVCNNAAVAGDGTIFFSDSSQRFDLRDWRVDLMEHSGTGRLLRRTPDGTVDVLIDGLQFANGVALALDESFVIVAETGSYRIIRHWLTGPYSGTSDILVEALPGFPDNVSTAPDGTFWVTQVSARNPLMDWAHAHTPWLLRSVARLPHSWQPQPGRVVWVLGVDSAGRIVRNLRTHHPHFDTVTGAREHDGTLYLGSLTRRAIAAITLSS